MSAENGGESAQISTDDLGMLFLEGLTVPDFSKPGPVETGVIRQVNKLVADGHITEHHAGPVALVLRAARDVDQSAGQGRPSGRANLLRAAKEIVELLPIPDVKSMDAFEKALEAMNKETSGP